MQRLVTLSIALLLCMAAVAQADPVVFFSQSVYNMTSNSDSGNTIQLLIVNDPSTNSGDYTTFGIQGIDLYMSIGNGNADPGVPQFDGGTPVTGLPNGQSTNSQYVINGGDPITGTIFAANHTAAGDGGQSTAGFLQIAMNTSSGGITVNDLPNGAPLLLATLHINTNGVGPGDYLLDIMGLSDTSLGQSLDLANPAFNLALSNATIHIAPVPEPASVVLGLFAVAGLGAVAIRRRRHAA